MILVRTPDGHARGQRRDVLDALEDMKRLGTGATCEAPGGVELAVCVPFVSAALMSPRAARGETEEGE